MWWVGKATIVSLIPHFIFGNLSVNNMVELFQVCAEDEESGSDIDERSSRKVA